MGKMWRWCRREPTLAASVAACALILVAGIAATSREWRRAEKSAQGEERQRRRAEQNATNSQEVARFLKDTLERLAAAMPRAQDRTELENILNDAGQRLSHDLQGQPLVEAELRGALGKTYEALGRYNLAESMYRRAMDLYEQQLGPRHLLVITALEDMARVLSLRGEHTQAEALLRQVLSSGEKALGTTHPVVLAARQDLSLVLLRECQPPAVRDPNKLRKAEGFARAELSRLRAASGRDASVARSLQTLAIICQAQGNLVEAETLQHEALSRFQQAFGEDSPAVAEALSHMGDVLMERGEFADAEGLYRQALALQKKLLGDDLPEIGYSLGHLASSLHKQGDKPGKLAEAEQVTRQALAVHMKTDGEAHPHTIGTLEGLAGILFEQGDFKQSEALDRKALAISQRALGNDRPETENALLGLSFHLAHSGKPDEAERLMSSAVAEARSRGGVRPEVLAKRLASLGHALVQERKYEQAEAVLLECHALLQRSTPVDPAFQPQALGELVQLYQAWDFAAPSTGKAEQAQQWREASRRLRSQSGTDSESLAR
jgi:tetratricopeptide (TPR) repeat protein